MATEYKSPLPGLLDYIVPDRLEQQAISAFARNPNPMNEQGQPLYGNFRPNIDPNNPQGLSNIETLFGTAYMPQAINYSGSGPTNKQMIDAAILRAGLEMGKGRQPGETFGGALARGVEAAGQPAKTLAAAQAAAAKSRGSRPSQVSMPEWKLIGLEDIGNGLMSSDENFAKIVDELEGGQTFVSDSDIIRAIAANAASIQSADPTKTNRDAMLESANQFYQGRSPEANAEKVIPVVDNSNNKPNIPGIIIK
jgi:hypothetical protein